MHDPQDSRMKIRQDHALGTAVRQNLEAASQFLGVLVELTAS